MSMDPGGTDTPLPGDPPAIKAGINTTEFWLSAGTAVSGVVVAVLALFGKHVNSDTLKPLIGSLAILGPMIITAFYSHSRAAVKVAALQAHAAIVLAAARPTLAAAALSNTTMTSGFITQTQMAPGETLPTPLSLVEAMGGGSPTPEELRDTEDQLPPPPGPPDAPPST